MSCDLNFNTIQQNLVFESCDNIMVFQMQGVVENGNSNSSNSTTKIYNEILSGILDGSNATFMTSQAFVSGTEEIKINGLTQLITRDYTISPPKTIQFTSSPEPNDRLFISYNKL